MNLFFPILPTLILILMGMAIRKKLIPVDEFWQGLEKMVFFIFFPILLFEGTINANLSVEYVKLGLLGLLVMGIGIVISWIAIKFFHASTKTKTSIFQCGFRFNTYVGIAIISAGFESHVVAYYLIITGICVPLANFAAVSALSVNSGNSILKEVARNPLIIATILGIILNLLGFKLPEFIQITFKLISNSAIVVGLIAVGAALRFESMGLYRRLSFTFLSIKLLILPIITIIFLHFVELNMLMKQVLIIFAALPTASTAYILAMRMNGDGKIVALQISLGSILSMFTIPLSQYLFQLSLIFY